MHCICSDPVTPVEASWDDLKNKVQWILKEAGIYTGPGDAGIDTLDGTCSGNGFYLRVETKTWFPCLVKKWQFLPPGDIQTLKKVFKYHKKYAKCVKRDWQLYDDQFKLDYPSRFIAFYFIVNGLLYWNNYHHSKKICQKSC